VVTITIGLSAALLAFMIMYGFRNKIEDRIYNFSGHLIINKITSGQSLEELPFDLNLSLYQHPDSFPGVRHVQEFSHKAGLIRTDSEILGIMLKAVGKSFDTLQFRENMVEGRFIHFQDSGYSNEMVISRNIADRLNVKTGDELVVHFFQNPPRARKLRISGIYETNLSDYFDEKTVLCDLSLVRRLNGWDDHQAGGLEIFLNDPKKADRIYAMLQDKLPYELYAEKTSDRYIQVFEWLKLIARQVNILLVIILAVVGVNMISVILILVMERTQMIGLLKAMGARDHLIRKIFFEQGSILIFRGLLAGNILGLGLGWIQDKFRVIRLDPRNYYMEYVPVAWDPETIIMLNAITFLMVFMVTILPVTVISRVKPVEAIRFD